MNIDFSKAPPDATHYMLQKGVDHLVWFFNINGDEVLAVWTKGPNEGRTVLHKKQRNAIKEYLNGEYNCEGFELNFTLENE